MKVLKRGKYYTYLSILIAVPLCSLMSMQVKTVHADSIIAKTTDVSAEIGTNRVVKNEQAEENDSVTVSDHDEKGLTGKDDANIPVKSDEEQTDVGSTTSAIMSQESKVTEKNDVANKQAQSVDNYTDTSLVQNESEPIKSSANENAEKTDNQSRKVSEPTESEIRPTDETLPSSGSQTVNRVNETQNTLASGQQTTGFYKDEQNSNIYYYDSKTASKVTGQKQINSNWYLFDPNTGAMQTGFQTVANDPTHNKVVYYANSGQMVYGQQQINGQWYLFNRPTGEMQTGFQIVPYDLSRNKTVYYNNNGQMLYNQQQIDGHWYLFHESNGEMQTGFRTVLDNPSHNKRVYYNNVGQMVYDQQQINGYWYLFDIITGEMQTGFQTVRDGPTHNKLVYYNDFGQMLYGEQKISGYWYLFDELTGAQQIGFKTIAAKPGYNKKVYYNNAGQMQYDQQHIGKYWYVFDEMSGAMLYGFQTVVDSPTKKTTKIVYYDTSGHMVYGWQQIGRHRYYFDTLTGKRQVGHVTIGNTSYSFSNSGILSSWIERTINWFVQRKGKITYSMYGSRNGSDGTADCSGAMTEAIWKAGASRPDSSALQWGGYNTVSMRPWLTQNGFQNVINGTAANNSSYEPQYGDVIVWGDLTGAAGHVMIVSRGAGHNADVISVCGYNDDAYHQAVQEFNYDWYYAYDDRPSFHVYRLNNPLKA